MSYAELQVTSNYSFLRGGSHVEEYFEQAAAFGMKAIAITDHHTLAGIPRAWAAAKTHGVRLVAGCRLDLADGTGLLVYPEDRLAYGRLCRMLTVGKARAGKGQCHLDWDDLAEHGEGWWGCCCPTSRMRGRGRSLTGCARSWAAAPIWR